MGRRRRGLNRPASWMMRRFFDDSFFDPMELWEAGDLGSVDVDVFETAKEVIVEASVPGYKEKDIGVSIEGHVLIIEGEKKERKQEKGVVYHRKEVLVGRFCREIRLPVGADESRAEVGLEDGVLCVRIPKKGGKRRRIW